MRRRGRDVGLGGLFVAREHEPSIIGEALAAAQAGAGQAIVIEGPAGTGKSRLLTVAGDTAREMGLQVLGAAASELEREFPLGVAIQLFEPRWTAAGPQDRAAMLDGPAGAVGALLNRELFDAAPWPRDPGYPLIHGLFWVASNLSLAGPLAILVDDVHWSDPASLRFLNYLAARLAALPILLLATVREGEAAADQPALDALTSSAAAVTLRPRLLSEEGVESVVRSEVPDPADEFIEACARLTRGNPLLLTELLADRPDVAARVEILAELGQAEALDGRGMGSQRSRDRCAHHRADAHWYRPNSSARAPAHRMPAADKKQASDPPGNALPQ